ncbi:hypothetical protein D3C77_402070 [compost metagenome]
MLSYFSPPYLFLLWFFVFSLGSPHNNLFLAPDKDSLTGTHQIAILAPVSGSQNYSMSLSDLNQHKIEARAIQAL